MPRLSDPAAAASGEMRGEFGRLETETETETETDQDAVTALLPVLKGRR